MTRFAEQYKVESNRLAGWDYSDSGTYFITICSWYMGKYFGNIIDGKMEFKAVGEITEKCLLEIPLHFSNVRVVDWTIMPNHLHILVHVETHDRASLQDNRKVTLINYSHKNHPNYFSRLTEKSNQIIPNLVSQFKSSVKRETNKRKIMFAWQSRYYDEIVNDDSRLQIIKQYIRNNVKNWEKDKFYNK